MSSDNFRCEEKSYAHISILDTRNLAATVENFYKMMDRNGIEVFFDENSESLKLSLQDGNSHTFDLKGVNTLEAFESILNTIGSGSSGEYSRTHGPVEHSFEILETLPDTSHIVTVCDRRRIFDEGYDPERDLACDYVDVTQ